MKKSILTTLITTTMLATTATAFAYGNKGQGKGMMMDNMSADDIKARIERRVSANPNLKVIDFEEKDGKYHYKIVTKDDSLVKEVMLDPKNPTRGGMMGLGASAEPMTMDQVKSFLEGHLQMMGNENIKLGEVTQDGGMIKATIVTKDNSLVKELSIDPSDPHGNMYGLMKDGKHHMKGKGHGKDKKHHGKKMKDSMQNNKANNN